MSSSEVTVSWRAGCYIKANVSNIVDLTHDWHEGMTQLSFFPPMIQEVKHTHKKDGIFDCYNHLMEECGTHCESPAHLISGAPTNEKTPLSSLIGPAVVINVLEKCRTNPDYRLSQEDLVDWETRHGRIPDGAWLIMYSGWSDRWDSPAFFNTDANNRDHYPGFDPAVMRWLVETNRHITGIATECMSPEGGSSMRPAKPVKRTGLTQKISVRDELLPVWNTLVIEDMANVSSLPEAGAWIIVGVIPFRSGSAGQSRIFGVLPVDW